MFLIDPKSVIFGKKKSESNFFFENDQKLPGILSNLLKYIRSLHQVTDSPLEYWNNFE